MAKKVIDNTEVISEDIVEQELILPSEEVVPVIKNGLKDEGVSVGHPSRDFITRD